MKSIPEGFLKTDGQKEDAPMHCSRCKAALRPGEERIHHGQNLCEDCYMDALSPAKACDPWAVHSAKTFEKYSTQAPRLTSIQKRILDVLQETGGIEKEALMARLDEDLTMPDLERELAVLRHMEKARGEKRDDRVVVCLW